MLLERGIVTEISADFLKVTCRSKIDCLRCAQGKGCGGGILARWLGDRQYSIKAHYDPMTQFCCYNVCLAIVFYACLLKPTSRIFTKLIRIFSNRYSNNRFIVRL